MTRLQHGAVRQGVQTAADVAFSGESLGEALKHNAPMVMIDAVQGYVAQRIGEWHHGTEEEFIAAQDERLEQSNGDIESIIFTAQETSLLDSITHKLMHSVLGAGIAAIQHEDIAAGAIAAPLGEMISETYGKYQKSQIQQDYKDGKISVREVSERLSHAKVSAVEVAKVGTAVAALFTGRDVNTATNAAGNAAENNFVPVLVAGAVIAMQIATAIDVATNCYEFKVAMDKGDVDGAIAAGVAVGMAAVPGQKLIPAPLRKAVHGVVTKSVTRILHSKYGQAAVKAGGAALDAASGKVQNLTARVADSSLVKGAGKKLEDWGVSKGGKEALHQGEKSVAKDMSPRVKPKAQTTAPAADKNYFNGNPKIKQLDRKGFVEIDGIQIRGVRDLSHMSDADVWQMFRRAKNPIDMNGDKIIYHHFGQQYHRAEGAFMAQIPEPKHGIWNPVQHPYGNAKGAGLNKMERNEWKNKDNPMLNKVFGEHELRKRGLLDE